MTSNDTNLSVQQSDKRFVLYLTPAEEDVWTNVMVMSQEHGDELIVDIPVDPKDLVRYWRSEKLESTTAEYQRAVAKLTESGILVDRGLVAKETKRRYAFAINPELFLTLEIYRRPPLWFDADLVAYIRDHQHRFLDVDVARPTRDEIMTMIDTRNPRDEGKRLISVSHKHLSWLYLGQWAPNARDSRLANGLFRPVSEGSAQFAVTYPGYEPYRFYSNADVPVLGARLYFLRGDEECNTVLFTPPMGDEKRMLLGSEELFHDDGEPRLDWTNREMLEKIPFEDLLLRKRFYDSLAAQLTTWSATLDEVLDVRRKQEEERERKMQELEELERKQEEAERKTQEAQQHEQELRAVIQQNREPLARWSIPRVVGRARCMFCDNLAMPNDTVCYECK